MAEQASRIFSSNVYNLIDEMGGQVLCVFFTVPCLPSACFALL
jgi:hypothetical protein